MIQPVRRDALDPSRGIAWWSGQRAGAPGPAPPAPSRRRRLLAADRPVVLWSGTAPVPAPTPAPTPTPSYSGACPDPTRATWARAAMTPDPSQAGWSYYGA